MLIKNAICFFGLVSFVIRFISKLFFSSTLLRKDLGYHFIVPLFISSFLFDNAKGFNFFIQGAKDWLKTTMLHWIVINRSSITKIQAICFYSIAPQNSFKSQNENSHLKLGSNASFFLFPIFQYSQCKATFISNYPLSSVSLHLIPFSCNKHTVFHIFSYFPVLLKVTPL